MPTERYELPRPIHWVAVCDIRGCGHREPLIRVGDAAAIVAECCMYSDEQAEENVARAVAVARGWRFGTHVGEPNHLRCPKHAEGSNG